MYDVILHEVAHLKHHHHRKSFWKFLSELIGEDAKQQKLAQDIAFSKYWGFYTFLMKWIFTIFGKDTRNFEAGILTDNPELVEQAMNQFDNVWIGRHCRTCKRKDFCEDPIAWIFEKIHDPF